MVIFNLVQSANTEFLFMKTDRANVQIYVIVHYVKSVQIWSYVWAVFSCIRLKTEIYSGSLRIQSEYRKIRYRNNWALYLDTFHAAIKAKCFNSFTINSRSKLEKLSTLFWGHLPRKIHYETEQGFMTGSFHNSFFVKNFSLNLSFFKYCRVLSIKNIEKKKEKRRIRKSQTATTNIFYFQLYRKNCTLLQNIFGKT